MCLHDDDPVENVGEDQSLWYALGMVDVGSGSIHLDFESGDCKMYRWLEDEESQTMEGVVTAMGTQDLLKGLGFDFVEVLSLQQPLLKTYSKT